MVLYTFCSKPYLDEQTKSQTLLKYSELAVVALKNLQYNWYIPWTYPVCKAIKGCTLSKSEVTMEQSNVLKTSKGLMVVLPSSVALPENVKKVDIVALGRVRLITPAGEAWDNWFDSEGVTEDFMPVR